MAINWNQAEYVAPKLQIVPEQLPVEAGVKVGAVLQDRFDKSYENLTKSEEALRQMALNANEVDRPEVERIYNQYSEQLKGIDKTDLHNARWKTLKLATEAANNYMSVAQRNKEIQAQEEMISKDPRYALKREEALQDFRKGLSSVGWDADKRTFSNLNISPYSAAADVDKVKYYTTYGKLMEPIVKSIKNKTVVPVDENGNETTLEKAPYFKTINTQGQVSILPASQLFRTLKDVGMSDDNVRAELERDARRTGKTVDQLFEEEHVPALKAVSKLLAQSKTQTVDQEDIKVNKNYGALSSFGTSAIDSQTMNMAGSLNEVDIDKSKNELLESFNKFEYNEDGSLNYLNSTINLNKSKIFGDLAQFAALTKNDPKQLITKVLPPKFYDTLKNKGLSDRDIINAYGNHAEKLQKIVNTDWSFIAGADQKQSIDMIMAAAQGAPFIDQDGKEVKQEDIKGGQLKINPAKGEFKIVNGSKTYKPKVQIPAINNLLSKSAELINEFTDLNSMTNMIDVQGNDGNNYKVVIRKNEIRPDGSYTGSVSKVVQIPTKDGTPKYQIVGESKSFDTKKEGTLTPESINATVSHLMKNATQNMGVK